MIESIFQKVGFLDHVDFANNWTVQILEVSLLGAIVVAFALILQRMLHRRVSTKFLYCMWMLVLIRFVLFWTPESPTSLINSIHSPDEVQNVVALNEVSTIPAITIVSTPSPAASVSANPIESTASQHNLVAAIERQEANWFLVAGFAWLCGCAFLLAKLLLAWLSLRLTVSSACEAKSAAPSLSKVCEDLRKEMKVRSKVQLLITDRLSTPATAGIFRPVILVPRRCLEELNRGQLRLVLAHELVHVRRHDGILQLIAWLIQTIHWFNPFIHLAVRRMADHRELSCDNAVLKGLSHEARKRYGETILKLAELETKLDRIPLVLAHRFTGSNRNLITQRIDMIIKPNSTRLFGTFLGALLLLVMLAVGYTAAQNPATIEPKTQESSRENEKPTTKPVKPIIENSNSIHARNSAWPKPFPKQPIRYENLLCSEIRGLPGAAEIAKEIFSSSAAADDTETKPKRESWASVRKEALFGNTLYTKPYPKGDLRRSSDILIPSNVPVSLVAGSQRRFEFDKEIPELVVSHPEFLGLTQVSPCELIFAGLEPGVCLVTLKFEDGSRESTKVQVCHATAKLEQAFSKHFPLSKVKIVGTADGISLQGTDSNSVRDNMVRVAEDLTDADIDTSAFHAPNVTFKIQAYEFSVDKFRALGIKRPDKSQLSLQNPSDLFFMDIKNKPNGPTLFRVLPSQRMLKTIEWLERHAVVKRLDQPTIVPESGKWAEYSRGDELPRRVHFGKKYRVGQNLELNASLINGDNFNLEVRAEFSRYVSAPPWASGTPSIHAHRLNSGLQMKFGQTALILHEPEEDQPTSKTIMFLVTPARLPESKP